MIVKLKNKNKLKATRNSAEIKSFCSDFDEEKLYIVISIEAGYFRLLGEVRKPLKLPQRPYLYPGAIFDVVEETIPESWVVYIGDRFEYQKVRDIGVFTYSNLSEINAINSGSVYAVPEKIGIHDFERYHDLQDDVVKIIDPYLEEIRKEQISLNMTN